jgi:serine/threonine-protein kinase RsbT
MTKQCRIEGEADIYAAAGVAREMAGDMNFGRNDTARIEIVVRELASNILRHAGRGTIYLRQVTKEGQTGLQVEAVDQGPGIPDVELAMQDGYTTGHKGLGSGLPAVRRLMDTFEIETEVGEGTTVRAVRWLRRSTDWLLRWWRRTYDE